MPADAHRGAVPPDPTRQAAQRLLDGARGKSEFVAAFDVVDVRLVAEAVMEAPTPSVREVPLFASPPLADQDAMAAFGKPAPIESLLTAEDYAVMAEDDPDSGAGTCSGCGGDGGDNWFDRSVCPDPCGMMHTRCSACGSPLEECLIEANEARDVVALQAEVVRLREALEAGRVALAEWLEEQGYSDLDADEIVKLVAARTALKEDA